MAFDIAFDGIQDNATFNLASGIARGTDEGKIVKLSAAGTVDLCSAEDKFYGVLETIDQDNAFGVVKETGYRKVDYSGSAPSAGLETELVGDGSGGVKTPTTPGDGLLYKVVEIDTTNTTLTMRLG